MQISQFVADIGYAIVLPYQIKRDQTHGDYGPFLFGNVIGVVFVVLFTDVYVSIARQNAAEARKTL